MGPVRKPPLTGIALGAAATLALAAPAAADVPDPLHDPASCTKLTPAPGKAAYKCDDGVPAFGGLVPNPTGASAVTVPARYRGYVGLPPKAGDAASLPGASAAGELALDVDVTLPATKPPRGGYPMVIFMHGCCGGDKTGWEADDFDAEGEKWHYSNAWFAARGYVVVNYTARGFVDETNRGSTGQTQLDSRSFEINDAQHLACQILAAAPRFADVNGQPVRIDRDGIVATGGSYGGGFSWMLATDPIWTCTPDTGAGGTTMKLAAAAPKYGWTDLVYSLVPTGMHPQDAGLPALDGCDSGPRQPSGQACEGVGAPVGIPKTSIVSGLYATGRLATGSHTTFTPDIDRAFACLTAVYPPSGPQCDSTLRRTLPEFLRERSAYYQDRFWRMIRRRPGLRTPIFNAATNTDPLFTAVENRRMTTRLLSIARDYPIQSYYGDYQHFTQNKAKEWGDICGADRHVCTNGDYRGDFDRKPAGRVRVGVTTRLNRFVDHYARPRANRSQQRPRFNVTASTQICQQNAGGRFPADEPGKRFTAPTFERLAPARLEIDFEGSGTTSSEVEPNPHATRSDPVLNLAANGGACPVETGPAGAGVASFESERLERPATMIGAGRLTVAFEATGSGAVQLNARLYDVFDGGEAVLVDRGVRRVTAAEAERGRVVYEFHGNAWRFERGHRLRLELAQDDSPFVKSSTVPSSLTIDSPELLLPVRELRRGRCANVRTGGPAGEVLIGTRFGDRISGRGGADEIKGLRGPDCLRGGGGGDRVLGGRARDRVFGGSGADIVGGGPGNDLLRGGPGDDQLAGERGRDRMRGGAGQDIVRGGRGNDRIHGGAGRDRIDGGRGRDRLVGGAGKDVIRGGRGPDFIKAVDGRRDRVLCGPGRDRVRVDLIDEVRGCERGSIAGF